MLLDQQKRQIETTDKKPSLLMKIYSNLFQARQPQTQVQRNLRNKRESVSAASANHAIFPPEALPHERPVENVWHIINNLLSAVCITHPHLDHVAGLVINSGNFNIFKPKTVVGLTSTIDSLLQYIFNGVVWPNLTNEGIDPVGLITLQRLRKAKPHQNSITTSDSAVAAKYSRHGMATNLSVLPFEVSHGTACQVAGRRHSSVASMNGVHLEMRRRSLHFQRAVAALQIRIRPQTHRRTWHGFPRTKILQPTPGHLTHTQLSTIIASIFRLARLTITPILRILRHTSPLRTLSLIPSPIESC